MTHIQENVSASDHAELRLVRGDGIKYKPVLLSTKQLLDKHWPFAKPLLEDCIDKAAHGELEVSDIYDRIVSGHMYAFVFCNEDGPLIDTKLALVLEVIHYPKLPTLNVVAIAGNDLSLLCDGFWQHVRSWAYMNGARAIDALLSPAMARLVAPLGFEKVYQHVRCDITEGIEK